MALVLTGMALYAPVNAQGANSSALADSAAAQTLTGAVSCEQRSRNWNYCRKNETPMSCTLRCVDSGGAFVLMLDGRHLLLKGDAQQLRAYAGGKATVNGTVADGELNVAHVEKARH